METVNLAHAAAISEPPMSYICTPRTPFARVGHRSFLRFHALLLSVRIRGVSVILPCAYSGEA